jgi:hypothetical protein
MRPRVGRLRPFTKRSRNSSSSINKQPISNSMVKLLEEEKD